MQYKINSHTEYRINSQGVNFKPQILVVTRLITYVKNTKCNQELESIFGTKYSNILRIPFETENEIVRRWVSRFDIYPYLKRFTKVKTIPILSDIPRPPPPPPPKPLVKPSASKGSKRTQSLLSFRLFGA
ncbi:unnamed protein product [Arabidopsis thaliana]|uniref:sucrose synthase n=1 Tax=Arabidopsis thaliana TaxID=3702 RepID=A0A5S9XNR3_ARATH|nr:unnamed protein product [Arabidopsis thaliana]